MKFEYTFPVYSHSYSSDWRSFAEFDVFTTGYFKRTIYLYENVRF